MTEYLDPTESIPQAEIAQVFDDVSFWCAQFGALLLRNIEIRPNLRILDLACGTGFPLFELAHRFGRTCFVVGADIWREALQRACLKQSVYGTPNVGIVMADGTALPLADATVDVVTSNLGINNFEKPVEVYRDCRRVLKKGGRLVITSNIKGHMPEFYAVYRRTLKELGLRECLPKLQENEDHRRTAESIAELLRGVGFRAEKVVKEKFVLRYADGSALLRHPLTRFGFLDGWKSVVAESDHKRVFAALEKNLNDVARKHGALSLTVQMLYLEAER